MDEFLNAAVRGLGQGALYAMLGLGFVIIYKSTRVVNFAQPALMILGAYWTSYLALTLRLGFWVALPIAIVITALIGAVVERIALRPMVGEPAFSATMVTVGVFIVLQVIASDLMGLELRQVGDPWGLERFRVGGVVIFYTDVAKLVFMAVALVVLAVFFKRSRAGLGMRATAVSHETALAQGVPVGRMFSLSWAIAGALAAVAGMLVGTGGAGFNQNTTLIALKAVPAIVLGGLDSVPGAVVGGLLIGLAEAFTKTYQPDYFPWLGANFDQVVPYILMLLVLLVRPYGLFGTEEVRRV
jgi:branched-chain amino acid transport system permease protein